MTELTCKILEGELRYALLDGVIEGESVDLVVTSPPYKDKDGWSPRLMRTLGMLLDEVLAPGARVFFNFGQLRGDYARPFQSAMMVAEAGELQLGQTIAWVKSYADDGVQRGHYQPINPKSPTLNYCWEYIFTMFKPPEQPLDRLSIGVPFAHKGNLTRGTRGQNGDVHCAGDVWVIPYKTTGNTKKKQHSYEFPTELARRAIKVANLKPGSTLLDPFCGSGTVLEVGRELGHNVLGIERNPLNAHVANDRWHAADKAAKEKA